MNQPTNPPHTDSPADQSPDPNTQQGVVELVTVLVAVTHLTARVLTVNQGNHLPSGLLTPIHHSLQAGVRDWVKKQTAQPMGYVEQLYTFVDTQRQNRHGLPVLYVSYLGLVNEANEQTLTLNASWQDWYDYFPWEDRRHNQEPTAILTALQAWATAGKDDDECQDRHRRVALCWGLPPYTWSEEQVLLRYELLYETGLVVESPYPNASFDFAHTGKPMHHNHRRVLATALARLRAKIKYRPVIFELMADSFTLLQLQKSVEALTGQELHKQNFRRQILGQNLIEAIDGNVAHERGRPAQLYRFKDDVLLERLLSNTRLPVSK